jgi:hypothetical protein
MMIAEITTVITTTTLPTNQMNNTVVHMPAPSTPISAPSVSAPAPSAPVPAPLTSAERLVQWALSARMIGIYIGLVIFGAFVRVVVYWVKAYLKGTRRRSTWAHKTCGIVAIGGWVKFFEWSPAHKNLLQLGKDTPYHIIQEAEDVVEILEYLKSEPSVRV